MKWILVFVLATAGTAMGQTTRPVPAPVSLVGLPNDVREEIISLRRELTALRAEVKELKALRQRQRPDANQNAAVPKINDPKVAAAVNQGRLAIGMKLEEAEAAMRRHAYYGGCVLRRETTGRKLYEFTFMAEFRDGQLTPLDDSTYAWFEDDKLVEWSK